MRLLGLWWWVDRWRKSTAYTDMSLEEQGAYRNLLDEAALRGGPIPNNERVLAKASGDATRWPEVRAAVLAHFKLTADGWRNRTLDSVLAQSHRRAQNQAEYRARLRGGDNGRANGADNPTGHALSGSSVTPTHSSRSVLSGQKQQSRKQASFHTSDNNVDNTHDNNPDNKPDSPDPDPSVRTYPPTPLAAQRGFRLSKRDLKKAAEMRERVHGGCPHDPRCQTYDACLRRIAGESKAAAS